MKEKLAEANKHYKELEALTNKDTIQVAYKDRGGDIILFPLQYNCFVFENS